MLLVKRRVGFVLDAAQIGLAPEAFSAFRRIVLKQFGEGEFEADLCRLFERSASGPEGTGTGRSHAGEKGGAP